MNKDEIMKNNTEGIKEMLKEFNENNLDKYVKKNLTGYLSNALRITQYYGNLRIKYLSFNYTLIGFYASIIAIFISLSALINPWLSISGLPIIIGLIIYFRKFMALHNKSFDTISFNQSDLQHFSCIMDRTEYPILKQESLKKFMSLLKASEENNPIENDLTALILQYFYQANYNNVGLKIRNCLIFGMKVLVYLIILSVAILVNLSIVLVVFSII